MDKEDEILDDNVSIHACVSIFVSFMSILYAFSPA